MEIEQEKENQKNSFCQEYFKETWENEEKEYGEGAGGRIIMLEKEKLDLMTVRTKTIRYADLDANPNYAEPDM